MFLFFDMPVSLPPGNAGFETADHIVGNTAFIHMASRCVHIVVFIFIGVVIVIVVILLLTINTVEEGED